MHPARNPDSTSLKEVRVSSVSPDRVSGVDWLTVAQFAFSIVGFIGLGFFAFSLALSSIVQQLIPSSMFENDISYMLIAAGCGCAAVALGFSGIYSMERLLGRSPARYLKKPRLIGTGVLILAFLTVLQMGEWASKSVVITWAVLPWLHILAVAIPVYLLMHLGLRNLPAISSQRAWGLFASGISLAPFLILIAEIIALLVFVFLGAVIVSGNPELVEEVIFLGERLTERQYMSEDIVPLIVPFVTRPAVLFAILIFGALVVPLIEELIKPIGVWLLIGRSPTAIEGFQAGLLCGAGYALFESLVLASSGENWAAVVTARAGTAIIHIVTTGLSGWALALAWRKRKFARLGMVFLIAVVVHALWNGLTLLSVFATLIDNENSTVTLKYISELGWVAPIGLIALVSVALLLLYLSNQYLCRGVKDEVELQKEN